MENYRKEIIDSNNRNKVIYFWGTDCPHCVENHGTLVNLEKKYNTISFYEMNTKENMKMALELKIRTIPTVLLYKGSELVKTINHFDIKSKLDDQIIKYLM
jgi:thiol-disulfide isomerase/thioredoxin